VRFLHELRGEWRLRQGEWAFAVESLHEAIRMSREAGVSDNALEAWLALAQFRLGQLPAASHEAARLAGRLAGKNGSAQLVLAELWHAIGAPERAAEHAAAAYRWAWADGEPYVHRYELSRATALLRQLGAEIPGLPVYDPALDQPLAFEIQVRAFIEELRAERQEASSRRRQSGS
jgi:tetratricopeptide (TPR) repeat protein